MAPELLLDLHLAAPDEDLDTLAPPPDAAAAAPPGAAHTARADTAQQTWARAPPRAQLRERGAHLRHDAFSSVAYESAARLRLAAFERLRLSAEWEGVVRAKGFVSFVECPEHMVTLQACGARLEATVSRATTSATCTSRLVLIGQGLQAPKLLRLLRECEVCA